jgi:hypothetical protein
MVHGTIPGRIDAGHRYFAWGCFRYFGDDAPARVMTADPSGLRSRSAQAEKVNSRDGLAGRGIRMAVVFGCNLPILLIQLQPLLI